MSHRWQHYPTTWFDRQLRAAGEVLSRVLPAFGLTILFIFGFAAVGEEMALDLWMDHDRAWAISDALDQGARMTLGISVLLTLVCVGASFMADAAVRATTSRALAQAADDGADRHAVPHPRQVGDVVTSPVEALRGLAWGVVVVGGIAEALLLIVVLAEHRGLAWMVGVGVAMASAWCVLLLRGPRLSRSHQARRDRISAHWTPEDEEAAWSAMRAAAPDREKPLAGADDERDPVAGRLRRIRTIRTASWILLVVLYGMLAVGIRLAYPQARRSDLGPRADLGVAGESAADVAVLCLLGVVSMVALLLLGGALLEASARRVQRAWVQGLVRDPRAEPPTMKTLRHYVAAPGSLIASALATTAWVLLSLGTAVVVLGVADVGAVMEFYDDSRDSFAGLVVPGALVIAVAVGMLVGALAIEARAQAAAVPLSNELMARWPVLPRPPRDPKMRHSSHFAGPALHRGSGA